MQKPLGEGRVSWSSETFQKKLGFGRPYARWIMLNDWKGPLGNRRHLGFGTLGTLEFCTDQVKPTLFDECTIPSS